MSLTAIEIQREEVQDILESVEGVKKVYYQPPSTHLLKYPCIIYEFVNLYTRKATNDRYLSWPTYTVTLIDYDVESILQKRVLDLKGNFTIDFDRFFVADNLYHWVYTLVHTKSIW